jgi:hypothetical protein
MCRSVVSVVEKSPCFGLVVFTVYVWCNSIQSDVLIESFWCSHIFTPHGAKTFHKIDTTLVASSICLYITNKRDTDVGNIGAAM